MSIRRHLSLAALVAALLPMLAVAAHAQLTMVESGCQGTTLSADFGKQVEVGVGPDTCLYYGSFEGLRRRCAPFDAGTICDENLTFPVGIAFSTGGSFGSYMYVADYGIGDIHRAASCGPTTPFATLPGPGAIAFPPPASAYGDFLYATTAFDGPISRVSSSGAVTTWLEFPSTYIRFGPGGAWGTGLYSTGHEFENEGIVKISAAGVVTPFVTDFLVPEGFDWGFNGDMFATDPIMGEIYRIKPNGDKTLFATLPGAADVAFRTAEQALYVVSNQGGFYRITCNSSTTDVPAVAVELGTLSVSPNPTRSSCAIRFRLREGGITRGRVVDAAGRLVRHLPEAWRPAGSHSLTWDGLDEAGAPACAGAYFVQMFLAGEARSARMTIVR